MHKKVLSLLLACMMLLAAALPVSADMPEASESRTVTIVNLKNLERLAENCRLDSYSQNLVVSLQTDLDLEGRDFKGIPIFNGRFEGNGHTIRGLDISHEGSDQGFFRYLTESAVVHDLHLEGSVQPSGTAGAVGGFAGKNSGHIYGCSFSGTVSGKEYIGGITGENTVLGVIENCHVAGTVYGGHFVGGISGTNAGIIRSCENYANVNETPQKNEVELSAITLDSMLHSELASTVTDVGGIAGKSTGVIRDCSNYARVGYTSMGYNIGGIAGTQSGSIVSCENQGDIYGRKEVGGIVGQMEPSAVMEFQEDVVQILNRQLDGMGKAIGEATSNLQGAGDKILNRISGMYEYLQDAQDALDALAPDPDNPELPDLDAIQAARNGVADSLVGMAEVMEGVNATAFSALGRVSTNLHAITDQLNAMRTTVGNIADTTGGSVVDRSDEDTELDLSGKVAECYNEGDVFGDLNCGGITGAIAMENDLDVEEDWLITGENSLKFESELRAVILDCENSGEVTAGKQNVGGIAGLQSLGLVKLSRNTGSVNAENADYVGGISGRSMGFIRSSYANGEVFGAKYVGGIAGSASVATDSCTLVRFGSGVEKVGAILGGKEENLTDVENPISGNYYLAMREDPGAIDGISYEGQAQPLSEETFFLQENLPEMFRKVLITFRYDNGMERQFSVDFGAPFPESWIPPIPPKEGRQSYWKGMENADLTAVFFDLNFEQEYTAQTTTLESAVLRNDIPLLFVQGIFSEDTVLHVEASEAQVPVGGEDRLLEIWEFRTTEPDHQTQIRLQLPEADDTDKLRITIRGGDNTWREEEFHILGRYAVVPVASGDDAVAVVQTAGNPWLLILAATGAAVLCGILFVRKRKNNKS